MLWDLTRRRFDVLMFWSIDRLGRSTAAVTAALADLESQVWQSIRTRKPWMQLRRTDVQCCRWPQLAGLARVQEEGKKTLGQPKVGKKVKDAIGVRLAVPMAS
jgi:hypothetical protein